MYSRLGLAASSPGFFQPKDTGEVSGEWSILCELLDLNKPTITLKGNVHSTRTNGRSLASRQNSRAMSSWTGACMGAEPDQWILAHTVARVERSPCQLQLFQDWIPYTADRVPRPTHHWTQVTHTVITTTQYLPQARDDLILFIK